MPDQSAAVATSGEVARTRWPGSTPLLVGLYATVVILSLVQLPGQVTHDTRLELTSDPTRFLAGAFSMWHPQTSFGEIQNQAYGYLFPQGLFFTAIQHLHVPMWIGQRVWSALLLVLAIEGARRVALRLDLGPLPALCAGLAYGLAPRMVTTNGVISAESLVATVLPWVVLPLLLVLAGRIAPLRGILGSAAALLLTGGVNAAENLAILPLPFLLIAWAVGTRRLRFRALLLWGGAVLAATAWWLFPLVATTSYGLPFYDFVESARNTTSIAGWSESLRGTTHWVGYLVVASQAWWPAGWSLSTSSGLMVATAVVGGVGVIGLGRLEHPVRVPLVLSALLGFACIAIPHGTWAGGPLSTPARDALDGAFAAFRNVHKFDPLIRLPLAMGFAQAVAVISRRVPASRHSSLRAPVSLIGVVVLLLVALAPGLPLLANQMRTPGWTAGSDADWRAVSTYLSEQTDRSDKVTLVVPGAPFAANVWGWTIEEPMVESARTPWATRSQIPLSSGQNIRFLDGVQDLIGDANGTQALGPALARASVGYVVLRDDLDRELTETPSPATFASSMAQAGGITLVKTFGALSVWRVSDTLPRVRVTAQSRVRTVQGGPGDVVRAISSGALSPAGAAVVEGEKHWKRPVDLVTDGNVRTERAFGRIYDAVAAPMTAQDLFRISRPYHDYPGAPDARQVVARYDYLSGLKASSSAGYADSFGAVRPEFAPYAAVDFSGDSQWVTSAAQDPEDQWIQLTLRKPRRVRTLEIEATVTDRALVPVRALRVITDHDSRVVRVDPVTGEAKAELSGRSTRKLRVEIESAAGGRSAGPIGIRDIRIPGVTLARSLVVPEEAQNPGATVLLGTARERRACVPGLGGADCDSSRIRLSSETLGMDRTVHLDHADTWDWRGTAVARSRSAAAVLLDPLGGQQRVRGSSVYGDDPAASPRMAYDGDPQTSWLSAPGDAFPTMQLVWDRPQRISQIQVQSNESGGKVPRVVQVRARGVDRRVELDSTGTARVRPFLTRQLTLTFGGQGDSGVAISEIRFPHGPDVSRLLGGSGPTGAVCGLGPEIFIDGVPHATSVSGTISDVIKGTPLTVRMCRAPVAVDAGWHRVQVRSTEEFQVTSLVSHEPVTGEVDAEPDRSVVVRKWRDSAREIEVGKGVDSLLVVPENFNAGWQASFAGKALTSVRVDGWQQGWLLPASRAGVVDIGFRGQKVYVTALALGAAFALSLVFLLVLVIRRGARAVPERTATTRSGPNPMAGRLRGWRRPGVLLVLAGVAPWLAAGVVVGWSRRRWARSVLPPALLFLVAVAVDVADLPFEWTVAADAITALGVGWALAPALGGARR